ncbi:hypothetical protein [Burkholderia cepacia]|nr:hypothetical protein [Burkholderia cepacia]
MADPVNPYMRVNAAAANEPQFATIRTVIGRPAHIGAGPLAEARRTS